MIDKHQVEKIRQSWRLILPTLLLPAKKYVNGEPSYICPFCSHGVNGDGLTFDPTHLGRLHCFGPCGWSGDIIDLYCSLEGCDFKTAISDLSNILGNQIEAHKATGKCDSYIIADYTKFFVETQAVFLNSPADMYLRKRGISKCTSIAEGLGYCEKWRHPRVSLRVPVSPRLIIPTSSESYLARDIRPIDVLSANERRYVKQKVGAAHIYGYEKICNASSPVFIVEGELDALSIMEVGSVAVALGSVSCINLFLKKIVGEQQIKQTFIVALDNDPAGMKASETLLQELRHAGLLCIDGSSVSGRYKDANEALVADYDSFKHRVKELEEKASKHTIVDKPLHGDCIDTYKGIVPTDIYIRERYNNDIAKFAHFKNRRTGFQNLDNVTPFYPGLYALGGLSSLGKTTFAYQLGSQLASYGEHVLYFSIEQSAMELVSKGISRMMYEVNPKTAIPSNRLRAGETNADVEYAISKYAALSKTLYMAECNFNTSIEEVREAILAYVENRNTAPVIILDYLQALRTPDERMVQRESVDYSLRTLKDLQTELTATVIVVSSLNRANYMVPIGFESFKESGGIEYTCDVVWGIDLKCMDDPIFDSQGHTKTKREIISTAKAASPREVRLVCLKNRYGISSYSVMFNYIPSFDIFVPCEEDKFGV